MKHLRKSVLRGEAAKKTKPVAFPSFDRRPVNYFRDVLAEDDGETNAAQAAASPTQVEDTLKAERERWETEHRAASEEQFRAGVQQGREESAAEVKRALDLLQQYAKLLQAEKQELAGRAETYGVELAFALARKIIDTELTTRPEAIVEMARAAINQVLDCRQIQLKVNPEDLGYLRNVRDDLAQMLDPTAQLELHGDGAVQRGGCMIETERGLLDARVSSQLETLRAELAKAIPTATPA